ncbi:MAG: hypothetical protein ACXVKI_18185 [Flavisolibacter sp.]
MKNLFFLIAWVVLGLSVQGQSATKDKTFISSIGVKPSVPFGHFSNYSGFGLGGNIQGEFKPSRWGISLNAGYIDYFGKTVNGLKYRDFKYIPILAGLKYYLSSKSFLHGQAGPGFGTNKLGTSFWYGAGIGQKLGKTLDAELAYTGWKQSLTSTSGTSIYGPGTTGGTGGAYGGHYRTIDLRIGFNF